MELSSDNLFAFVFKKYKLTMNRDKKGEFPKYQISLKRNANEEEIKKSIYSEIINYFSALLINNSNISNIIYNSIDPLVNECFNNLEYLSITNNLLRNLNFILNLPNLFFLDLFRNPLDELTALNNKNIFGYLRLSVEEFNENKILNIFNLQCGILDLDLKDKTIMKMFHFNNHHICMANNEINYIIDKIKYEEIKLKSINKRNSRRNEITSTSFYSYNDTESNNIEIKNDSSGNQLAKNLLNNNILEKPIKKVQINNPFLLRISKFFNDYQIIINDKIQDENYIEDRNKKKLFLCINDDFSSLNYIKNKNYLEHEKEKLILLFEIYKKLSIFNFAKNNNRYYIGNIYNINENKVIDSIFVKEVKTNIMNHSQIPRTSIVILISIIFYIIGTISNKMMSALINYILSKYYEFDENKKYPDFSEMGDIHYLTFYYSTYDYIYKRMIDNEKNINIEKYKDILNILLMEKLILKSNYLFKKSKENKFKDKSVEFCEYKNIKINNEIKDIKELNITKEFLVLIEFLCDFIIYEKIEETIINNSCLGEYSYLIELKETIEETELEKKNNLISSSLSALKFQKNKKERIFNKFYFEKDKIKQIKNKDFNYNDQNDFYKNESFNNLALMSKGSILNNLNFNNNIENEYTKSDDIEVNNFFFINGHSRNKSNRLYMKKINYNFPYNKIKAEENNYFNEKTFQDENKKDIKLPNLYQNKSKQSYEEFTFLKKMIFDPEFLSQRARNAIKFEKQNKKINKKYINSMNKKKDKSENLNNQSKSSDSKESPSQANNTDNNVINYFDKRKVNSQLDSPQPKKINLEKFKTIFNSTNSYLKKNKLSIDLKASDKIILKTIKFNENYKTNKEINTVSDKKCDRIKGEFKSPFHEIPESFPGMTLLKYGSKKRNSQLKKIKIFNKKSPVKNAKNKENKNLSYKQIVINRIKQTVKDNILRNARRVAYPIYQSHS